MPNTTDTLADLTIAVVEYETAWRTYATSAEADVRRAAEASLGPTNARVDEALAHLDLSTLTPDDIYRALVQAAAGTRSAVSMVGNRWSVHNTHFSAQEVRKFIAQG